jgi:hypothetical protein
MRAVRTVLAAVFARWRPAYTRGEPMYMPDPRHPREPLQWTGPGLFSHILPVRPSPLSA